MVVVADDDEDEPAAEPNSKALPPHFDNKAFVRPAFIASTIGHNFWHFTLNPCHTKNTSHYLAWILLDVVSVCCIYIGRFVETRRGTICIWIVIEPAD